MDIKTKSGFKCSIDNEVLDDWEMLELFRRIDKGDSSALVDVTPMFLGDEQYNKLKEHIRKKHGKVKASVMVEEMSEIMQNANATKNS